jgi:diphthamide biosynthesis protein 4
MANHYQTLGLGTRQWDGNLSIQEIKQAYRKALLEHHPDKAVTGGGGATAATATASQQTVDAITVAYKILSQPTTKAEYDRKLRLQDAKLGNDGKIFHTGLDIIDLDDLDHDDKTGQWWKSCRCGQDRGFVVSEVELESELASGELVTGCRGCSLWLKVLFGVEHDEEQAV